MNTRNGHEVREMLLVHGIIVGLVIVSFVGVVLVEFAVQFA